MDPNNDTALAVAAVNALDPYWPVIAAGAATQIGKELPSAVKKLWDKIWGRCSDKPSARESLDDLLANTDDDDLKAAFRVQLRKLLSAEPDFAEEIGRLVEGTGTATHYHSETHGDRNVTVQGSNIRVSLGERDEKKK